MVVGPARGGQRHSRLDSSPRPEPEPPHGRPARALVLFAGAAGAVRRAGASRLVRRRPGPNTLDRRRAARPRRRGARGRGAHGQGAHGAGDRRRPRRLEAGERDATRRSPVEGVRSRAPRGSFSRRSRRRRGDAAARPPRPALGPRSGVVWSEARIDAKRSFETTVVRNRHRDVAVGPVRRGRLRVRARAGGDGPRRGLRGGAAVARGFVVGDVVFGERLSPFVYS